jgi:PAS domain S-box-containing protein
MAEKQPSREELLAEIAELRARMEEAEETLRAIRQGEVDALVVSGPQGDQIFTLKGANHTFRILVETINEGAATLAADGVIIYANRVLANLLKIPLEKLIGSAIGDYIPLPERELFEALLGQGKLNASKGEIILQTVDGALVPAYLSLSSMQLDAVPDTVCLAVTDLTEQKRQEAMLAEGRLFKAVLEQAEHAIVVCDAKGIITQASRATHQLFSGNPLLKRFEKAFPISVITGEAAGKPFAQAFSLSQVLRGEVYRSVEATLKRADGQEFFLLLDAGRITDNTKVALGCVVTLTDITERKRQEDERLRLLGEQQALTEELGVTNEELVTQTEELTVQKEELEKLNDELLHQKRLLEAANEEMEAFSYSVSHDLKTPVRAIEGFSKMLIGEHTDKLDAEGLRLLEVICANTRLMNSLIDDLLALSRLGRLQIRKSVINLTDMTKQVFVQLRSQELKRNIILNVQALPPALGDQSLLYQVMQNILSNAIKFTRTRQNAIIEVGGRTEGKENIFYIKDNGVGFDQRYARNMFRPFQRLQSNESGYEGTGVGLAIVKRIIQRHSGRVWAEGNVNEGATFYFSLPNNGE